MSVGSLRINVGSALLKFSKFSKFPNFPKFSNDCAPQIPQTPQTHWRFSPQAERLPSNN